MAKPIRYLALCALSALTLAAPLTAAAANMTIKCWTDKHGVRECGNTVPPAYSQGATQTLNDQGLTTQTQSAAMSRKAREQEARQQAAARKKAEQAKQRAQVQARYDRMLLATFGSTQEIIAARDRNIAAVNANISVTRLTMQQLQTKLSDMQAQAARRKRARKPIPKSLKQEMATTRNGIADKQAYLRSQEKQKAHLRKLYAGYLKRFKELNAPGDQ